MGIISNETMKRLQENWSHLVEPFTIDPQVKSRIFQQLVDAYSQPHRYYHTLTHIRHSLAVLAILRSHCQNFVALQFAAWFHDSVYDPKASDNEQKSAEFATIALDQLGCSPELRTEIIRLILLTQSHQTDVGDIDGQILLDADLAILGTPRSIYQHYACCIRQEYAFVGDLEYSQRRQQILTAFLQRDRIYATEPIHCRLESRARQNVLSDIRHQIIDISTN